VLSETNPDATARMRASTPITVLTLMFVWFEGFIMANSDTSCDNDYFSLYFICDDVFVLRVFVFRSMASLRISFSNENLDRTWWLTYFTNPSYTSSRSIAGG
jgi:hypothetical protein